MSDGSKIVALSPWAIPTEALSLQAPSPVVDTRESIMGLREPSRPDRQRVATKRRYAHAIPQRVDTKEGLPNMGTHEAEGLRTGNCLESCQIRSRAMRGSDAPFQSHVAREALGLPPWEQGRRTGHGPSSSA